MQYVTTARELLEQLGAETTPEGISSVSKAKLSEYSEKIEALAARLAAPMVCYYCIDSFFPLYHS